MIDVSWARLRRARPSHRSLAGVQTSTDAHTLCAIRHTGPIITWKVVSVKVSTFGESTNIVEAALTWYDAGCSIIPIRADGTKKPMFEWKQNMVERMERHVTASYFRNNPGCGIGIVCGAISGNLEMLELEGRAATGEDIDKIVSECEKRGIAYLFTSLMIDGYAEWTPSGGLHFLYRISSHEVPGNTKIARRPATEEELAEKPGDKIKVLAETRGEGGYLVVAPSGGTVHATGDSWSVAAGELGVIPTISWDERCRLHEAIHAALDQMPATPPPAPRPVLSTLLSGRPGDDFNNRAEWLDILGPHGWTVSHVQGHTTYWVRPGKDKRDGHSATTGRAADGDRLYVFSSSTEFDQETPYNKFSAYCVAPETKILMADLTWAAAGSLAEGDEVVGVDESLPTFNGRRKLRTATITGAEKRKLPCYEIELEDGRVVTCSDGHPWLARSAGRGGNTRWIQTKNLRPGQIICSVTNGTWETATDFDSGWLSGMFDGEGWAAAIIGLAQNPGPVLDRVEQLLKERGFNPKRSINKRGCGRMSITDLPSMLRLLGTLQPSRLVGKRNWEGRAYWTEIQPKAIVKETRFVGERIVAAFSTNTQTFIAEGLISHNTTLEHSGDYTASARALRSLGYGAPAASSMAAAGTSTGLAKADWTGDAALPATTATPAPTQLATSDPNWLHDWAKPFIAADAFEYQEQSYAAGGKIYAQVYEDTFKYCGELKKWFFFNGCTWEHDRTERFEQGVIHLLDEGGTQARREDNTELAKWIRSMGRASSPNLARWARSDPRIAVVREQFDQRRHLITLDNGVFDLDTATFTAGHDPKLLLTKKLGIRYDKDARAGRWETFLSQVLPNADIRSYIQRAAGLTLLGDAQERALFLLHGKSGTGKSQFIRVMELLFGDFAETASATTFNASSKTATLTNDLNDLRGKRFVSLSELDQDERLNESLVKRLTGGDTAKSRGLYQENRQWRVEFMMWMATNYLPRLNSDDNAIWKRVKPIEFPVEVATLGPEEKGLAEKIFAEEASGILNWLLEGVRMYQEHGLEDPDEVSRSVATYRRDVDSVAQFIDAAVEEHTVVRAPEQQMPSRNLNAMYQSWCIANGIRWLGERRFAQRMESLGFERKRTNTGAVWLGIGTGNYGMLGTMAMRQ